jgi:hypothetical protein
MRAGRRYLLFALLCTFSFSLQTPPRHWGSADSDPVNADVLPLAFQYRAEVQEQIDTPALLVANFENPTPILASISVPHTARDAWLLLPSDALALPVPLRC